MKTKIDQGQLKLPPNSELPDGFDLFYQRRSLRRTYQYEMDGEQFVLTVCKNQAKSVNTDQTDMCSFDETEAKVSLSQVTENCNFVAQLVARPVSGRHGFEPPPSPELFSGFTWNFWNDLSCNLALKIVISSFVCLFVCFNVFFAHICRVKGARWSR